MGIPPTKIMRHLAVNIELPTGGAGARFKAIRYQTVGDFFESFLKGKFVLMHLHSIDMDILRVGWVRWKLDFSGGTTRYAVANWRRYNLTLDLPVDLYTSVWYLASMTWIRESEGNIKITINGQDVLGLLRSIAMVRNWTLYNRARSSGQTLWESELPKRFKKWGLPLATE